MVLVRSNGTFAVEYDEENSPKEDRIAETRLRHRNRRVLPEHEASEGGRCCRRSFVEGDVVLTGDGERGGCSLVMVMDASVAEGRYRVEYLDGTGTREKASDQLWCVVNNCIGGGMIEAPPQ